MSSLKAVAAWLGRLLATGPTAIDPEMMALHDWADLPTYHPC